MEFDLHRVKKITAKKIGGIRDGVHWRDIQIEMDNGEKLTLNLFANKFNKLIVKKEND